jgi:hypothetical protein
MFTLQRMLHKALQNAVELSRRSFLGVLQPNRPLSFSSLSHSLSHSRTPPSPPLLSHSHSAVSPSRSPPWAPGPTLSLPRGDAMALPFAQLLHRRPPTLADPRGRRSRVGALRRSRSGVDPLRRWPRRPPPAWICFLKPGLPISAPASMDPPSPPPPAASFSNLSASSSSDPSAASSSHAAAMMMALRLVTAPLPSGSPPQVNDCPGATPLLVPVCAPVALGRAPLLRRRVGWGWGPWRWVICGGSWSGGAGLKGS